MSTTTQTTYQSYPGTYIFHSATVPQFIQQEQQMMETDTEAQSSKNMNPKLSHSKLILHVLYYQKNEKTGHNQIKRRRFVLGNKDTKDLSDGLAEVNPLILKSVRTRLKHLLVSSPSFNQKDVQDKGGFLNKSLWQANLLWGTGDSLQNNLAQLMCYIKDQMKVVNKRIVKKGPRIVSTGKPKHRFQKKAVKEVAEQAV